MAHIAVIEPEGAEGDLKRLYDEARERRGAIANVLRIHSLHPPTMKGHLDLYLSVLYGPSQLSRKERETVAVAVSRLNGCNYCVEHHAEALGRYQKDLKVVDDLQRGVKNPGLSPRERALLEFAEKLTRDPQAMTRGDVEALRAAGLSDEEILMATLTVSYFNFVNRLVHALGVELEGAEAGPYKY